MADETFIDSLTNIDEKVDRLTAAIDGMGRITPDATTDDKMGRLLEVEEARFKKDYDLVHFSYPNDGTRATLAVGTTTLDFLGGTIKEPDGTVSAMSTNLTKHKRKLLRSCTMSGNNDFVVQLGTGNKAPVRADNWYVAVYQEFTKVYITCSAPTVFVIFASTSPKAAAEMVGETTVSIGRAEHNVIKSATTANFESGLAQFAAEEENLTGLTSDEVTITGVTVYSEQALDMRLLFFGTDQFQTVSMDNDEFTEFVDIDIAAFGKQYKNAGFYYYAVTGLGFDYKDVDGTQELHIALENLDPVAKLGAGAGGAFWLKIFYITRT